MTTWFLKAKHWQIFILQFGLPVVLQIAGYFSLILATLQHAPNNPTLPFSFDFLYLTAGGITLSMSGLLLWLWSVGNSLRKVLSPTSLSGFSFFKVTLVYSGFHILLTLFLFGNFFQMIGSLEGQETLPMTTIGFTFAFFFLSGILYFGCSLYNTYFVSNAMVKAENHLFQSSTELIGGFFSILFFPIGIWFLQPRVNRLWEALENDDTYGRERIGNF